MPRFARPSHMAAARNAQHGTWQRVGEMALGRGTHLRMAESVSPPAPALREKGRYALGASDAPVHPDLLEVPTSAAPVIVR